MTRHGCARLTQAWLLGVFFASSLVCVWTPQADAARRRTPKAATAPRVPATPIPPGSTHALKPLESLGMDSAATDRVSAALARRLAEVPGITLAPLAQVRRFLKTPVGAPYAQCEGDVQCITKLGALLGAPLLVAGDLSGLAKGYVLFLRLTNPASQEVVRTVSVVHDGETAKEAAVLKEAAYRLLAPERFVGTVTFAIDVPGAQVYLNGQLLGQSPLPPRQVQAGTHALRVTHPAYHDSLRFIEVAFEENTTIGVPLTMYPIISEEMRAKAAPTKAVESAKPGQGVIYRPLPFYKKWWFITTVGTVLLAATVTTVALARPRHLERDGSVTLDKSLTSPAPVLLRFGR